MPIDDFSWQEMVVGNGSSFHKKGPWFIRLREKSRLKKKKIIEVYFIALWISGKYGFTRLILLAGHPSLKKNGRTRLWRFPSACHCRPCFLKKESLADRYLLSFFKTLFQGILDYLCLTKSAIKKSNQTFSLFSRHCSNPAWLASLAFEENVMSWGLWFGTLLWGNLSYARVSVAC